MMIELDSLNKFILSHIMWDANIIPIDDALKNMNEYISQLPPDEARKHKRKFRKEWRKFARRSKYYVKAQMGLGSKTPTSSQSKWRKYYILYTFLRLSGKKLRELQKVV